MAFTLDTTLGQILAETSGKGCPRPIPAWRLQQPNDRNGKGHVFTDGALHAAGCPVWVNPGESRRNLGGD